jgi:hypothetical protein
MSMLARIFPRTIDNQLRGNKASLWLLIPIVIIRLMMGLNSTFNTRWVITNADNIPLDRYSSEAANTIVSIFSIVGLYHLVLAMIGLLAIFRYRSMIPLVYLLFLFDFTAKKILTAVHPVTSTDASTVNILSIVLISLMSVGFVLSIWTKQNKQQGIVNH